MKNNGWKVLSGPTPIELLVIIAIIGFLVKIVMVGLNSTRLKTRNAKRISGAKQLATAARATAELFFRRGHIFLLFWSWSRSAPRSAVQAAFG